MEDKKKTQGAGDTPNTEESKLMHMSYESEALRVERESRD